MHTCCALLYFVARCYIWWMRCQKQISRVGPSNYISQYLCDVITCPQPWYLRLAQHSWYILIYLSGIEAVLRCHSIGEITPKDIGKCTTRIKYRYIIYPQRKKHSTYVWLSFVSYCGLCNDSSVTYFYKYSASNISTKCTSMLLYKACIISIFIMIRKPGSVMPLGISHV